MQSSFESFPDHQQVFCPCEGHKLDFESSPGTIGSSSHSFPDLEYLRLNWPRVSGYADTVCFLQAKGCHSQGDYREPGCREPQNLPGKWKPIRFAWVLKRR